MFSRTMTQIDVASASRRQTGPRAGRPDIGVKVELPAQFARWIEAAFRNRRIRVVRHRPKNDAVGAPVRVRSPCPAGWCDAQRFETNCGRVVG